MIVLALTSLLHAAAPTSALEVVFLPDDPHAPALAVIVEDTGARSKLFWALGASRSNSPGLGGALEGKSGGSGLVLPRAPAGASVTEREGGVIVTIDDAGPWQQSLTALAKTKARGPAVADARALRLVVSSYAPGAPALLLGTDVRLSGRAAIARDGAPALAVVAEPARVVVARPSVVAEGQGCGGTVPRAFSAPDALLRLEADALAVAACTNDLAVVRVSGVRTDPKKDVPVIGIVVTRR